MKCCSSHTDSQGDSDLCGRQTPACIARWGATISATRKINIGHNHIGQSHIGHEIHGEFIWRHRVDTSLFRVGPGRIVNFNVKPRIRPIGQKEAYRLTSPVIEKMNVRFF